MSDLLNENRISILSAVFLGIAILSKAISAMLVPSFLLIYVIYFIKNKEKRGVLLGKKNITRAILSIIAVLILLIPLFSYNYLLYKETGLTDVIFARFFDVSKEFYVSIAHTIQPFSLSTLVKSIHVPIKTIYNFDLIISLLALLGFVISLIKNKFQLLILLALLLPVYIFIAGTSLLANHFVVFMPPIVILGSLPLYYLQLRINRKFFLITLLVLIALFNLLPIKESITTKSAVGELREYAVENINNSSLVVADARIYRGRIAWMLNDKHYIESPLIDEVFKTLEKVNAPELSIKTYFIECVKDDCGWGTIKDQQDLNQSQENLVKIFSDASFARIDITGGGGYDESQGEVYFRVYETNIQAKPQVLELVDKTHTFFFYPVRYEPIGSAYDAYTPKTFLDKTLNTSARIILFVSVLIALISIPYTLYLIFKNFKRE
ncbi:MAG: hypothetical protein HYS80_00250 [Candidatus Aenigmarchaeota archaeon]|nr:hypothetical protein [Candidatus Aenigmarchaeota archaeon]